MPEEIQAEKKKVAKGKKKKRNKPTSQKWKMYHISGEKITKERECPRCGPAIFLMKAANRVYCGKCGYTEFLGKTTK